MFDFDVVTGPGNATRPAKAATLPAPTRLTPPMPPAATASTRAGEREPLPSPSDPAAARP